MKEIKPLDFCAEPRMLPGTHLFDSLMGNQPLIKEQLEHLMLPREWRCHNVAHATVSETAQVLHLLRRRWKFSGREKAEEKIPISKPT